MTPSPHARRGDHRVELYESDAHLARSVAQHLLPALVRGEAALAIATPEHRVAVRAALAVAGVDVGAAEAEGRLALLDARAVLASFVVGGRPDAERFRREVGDVVARAAARFGGVRAFGEMVALLWADGQVAAAIELEDHWNDLADVCDLSLLCAYPLAAFGAGSAEAFGVVCDQHGVVLPTERHTALDELGQHRHVAELQQALRAAEVELDGLRSRTTELQDVADGLATGRRRVEEALAAVAHDVKTPVCVVQGFAQLLAERWEDLAPEARTTMLGRCADAAADIGAVVEDRLQRLHEPG